MTKLFEIEFSFTPPDDSSGQGLMTIAANSEADARAALEDALQDVPNLQITAVKEVADLPYDTTLEAPRTLQ